ncbi:MAG TPA: hypothetical protein VJA94_02845 [Candidatus Angelobacter sp.]
MMVILVLMTFQRQPSLHPSLFAFRVVDYVGVSHRRQFTGSVL